MDKSQRLDVVAVAVLMLVVALLTVPFLGRGGFWFDEIFSVTTASTWTRMGEVFSRYENNMALYYVLLHGWMGLGADEWTVRLLSTLCALATLPLMHVLACQLWNRRVAFIADILLVTSTLFLHHAMEARAYSLLLFFAVLSSVLFLQALRRPGWGWWIAYAVVAALSSYVHYFGILLPVAHALSLAWRERGTIPWAQVLVAAGLSIVLLIPQAIFRPPSLSQVDWLDRPDLQAVINVGTTFAGGRSRLMLYGLAMVLTLLFVRRAAAQSSERSWALWFTICWLVVPLVAALVVSLLVKPVFLPKYLIGSLPAMLLLVAVGLAQLRTWAVSGVLLLVVVQFASVVRSTGLGPVGPYREAAAHLLAHAKPGDAVICYPFYIALPMTYAVNRQAGDHADAGLRPHDYATGPYHPGAGAIDPDPDLQVPTRLGTEHRRVWLVASSESTARMNRAWRAQVEAAIAVGAPHRSVVSFEDRQNHDVIDVVLFEGEPAPTKP